MSEAVTEATFDEQVLQSEWKEAGFSATVNNTKAGTLFGQWLPAGTFDIGIYAQTPLSPHPGSTMCSNFCADNIPTTADNAAKIKAAWQKRAAINDARESLRPKLAAASIFNPAPATSAAMDNS